MGESRAAWSSPHWTSVAPALKRPGDVAPNKNRRGSHRGVNQGHRNGHKADGCDLFYDQAGNRITAESVVDVTGDLEVTKDGALSLQKGMEPLGELTISTRGQGELVTGSVTVVSDGPIGGGVRFDLPGIGVAGVGASRPVRDVLFPARRQGGLSTAAAIRNLGKEAMEVSCRLMKEGTMLEEVEIPLEANGQEARYIEELFTGTDTSLSTRWRCSERPAQRPNKAPPGTGDAHPARSGASMGN